MTGTGTSTKRQKVLLVDDLPANLTSLELSFPVQEYELIKANSGRDALAALLRHDVALIMMDVAMPDLSGIETAERIKCNDNSIQPPVIFMTANEAEASDVRRFRGLVSDSLAKPLRTAAVKEKVQLTLRRASAKRRATEAQVEAAVTTAQVKSVAKPRVMVVSEDRLERTELRKLLHQDQGNECEVFEAAHGQEALDKCLERAPDCILIDHKLGDLQLTEFLDQMHARPSTAQVPVIALTEIGAEGYAAEALEHGASDFLFKDATTAEAIGRAIRSAIAAPKDLKSRGPRKPQPGHEELMVVKIGHMALSTNPADHIVTYSLGSCIGLTLYDPTTRVGGMAHYFLPEPKAHGQAPKHDAWFADPGTQTLIDRILAAGADKSRLICKAAGGAEMLEDSSMPIGERNFEVVERILEENEIDLGNADIGGRRPRTLFLEIRTGITTVRFVDNTRLQI